MSAFSEGAGEGKRISRLRWRLRDRLPAWALPDHPVHAMEARYQGSGKLLRTLDAGCLPVILLIIAGGLILAFAIGFFQFGAQALDIFTGIATGMLIYLGVLIVLLDLIVTILTIARTSSIVSRELELQSWDLLRTTALPLHDILFAKLAGALNSLRFTFLATLTLRGMALLLALSLAISAGYFRVVDPASPAQLSEFFASGLLAPFILMTIIALLFFVGQPLITFFTNGAIGLFVSVRSKTRGRALAMGLLLRMGLGYAFNQIFAIIYFIGVFGVGFAAPQTTSFLEEFFRTLSWTDAQLAWVIGGFILVAFLAYLGIYLGASLFLLGSAQHRARMIGG